MQSTHIANEFIDVFVVSIASPRVVMSASVEGLYVLELCTTRLHP